MAQTLVNSVLHVIFSTKNRENFIAAKIEPELFAFIGGVLRKYESHLIAAGGTENHVHLLISQSKNMRLSDLIREIKKTSSLWIKGKDTEFKKFQWQAGFGAFSVSKSNIPKVRVYIARQKQHHRKEPFEKEYRNFLKKHEIDFDERYFLD